jgi:hypothetical protein
VSGVIPRERGGGWPQPAATELIRACGGGGEGALDHAVYQRCSTLQFTVIFRLTAGIGNWPSFPVPARPGGVR